MIDISPLQADPSGNEAADCIAAMHAACIETGFFVVLGHGLDDEIISLFAGVRRFFELPHVHQSVSEIVENGSDVMLIVQSAINFKLTLL